MIYSNHEEPLRKKRRTIKKMQNHIAVAVDRTWVSRVRGVDTCHYTTTAGLPPFFPLSCCPINVGPLPQREYYSWKRAGRVRHFNFNSNRFLF